MAPLPPPLMVSNEDWIQNITSQGAVEGVRACGLTDGRVDWGPIGSSRVSCVRWLSMHTLMHGTRCAAHGSRRASHDVAKETSKHRKHLTSLSNLNQLCERSSRQRLVQRLIGTVYATRSAIQRAILNFERRYRSPRDLYGDRGANLREKIKNNNHRNPQRSTSHEIDDYGDVPMA